MAEIHFSENNNNFQSLVRKAQEYTLDGSIDQNELDNLKKEVHKDGIQTVNEKLFLKSLENQNNIDKLKEGVDPINFFLDIPDEKVNIKFKNNDETFQNIVSKAIELSKDGKLSIEEIDDLFKIVPVEKSQDIINFLNALDIPENISKLQAIDKSDFELEVFVDQRPKAKEYEFEGNLNNPLESQIEDVGITKFNEIMKDKSITSSSLINEIMNLPRITNNESLRGNVELFILNLINDKEAAMYLKEILTDRKPPISDEVLGKTISKLANMLNTDYFEGVGSSRDLVVSALHDITAPMNIAQRKIGTCAGTCIQIQLAINDPLKYINILDTLAQNKEFTLESGNKLIPNTTYTTDQTSRSISSKIMQNAIMDFASGAKRDEYLEFDYINKQLIVKKGFNSSRKDSGLNKLEQKKAQEEILGKNVSIYENTDYTPKQLLHLLDVLNPSEENQITISTSFSREGSDAFHAVNVIGIDDKNVKIINPWGRLETVSRDMLEINIYGVLGDKEAEKHIEKFINKSFDEFLKDNSVESISKLVNKEGNSFLDKMKLSHTVDLLVKISKDDSTESKLLGQKVLEHYLQGKRGQDHQAIFPLINSLKEKNVNFNSLISNLKTNNNLFYDIGTQIFNAYGETSSSRTTIANILLDGSLQSKEFSKSLVSNKDLVLLGKGLNVSALKSNPEVIKGIIVNLIKDYNKGIEDSKKEKPVTKEDIQKFIENVGNNWNRESEVQLEKMITEFNSTKVSSESKTTIENIDEFLKKVNESGVDLKSIMSSALNELGYKSDNKEIDSSSAYSKFYYNNSSSPQLLGRMINMSKL